MTHAELNTTDPRITRAWNDIAPKLLAFLTGGTAAGVIVTVLNNYLGVTVDVGLATLIVTVSGTILGYYVKDKAPKA